MEEFSYKDYLLFFKKKFAIFLIVLLTVFVAGSAYSLFFKTPVYQSSSSIILSGGEKNTITQNDIALNKSLSSTYAEIAKSRQVIDKTISDLNLDYSYESLLKKISVTTVNDTVIIKISVEAESATASQEIANALADNFIQEIKGIYAISNIRVLDKAIVPKQPKNINIIKDELIYAAAGLAASTGFIFFLFLIQDDKKPQPKKIGIAISPKKIQTSD